ncbi:unnamed protein product [Caenorhabditis auriculariae]|uniref:Solute carrier organic anion transporter family member n=1 Tax=Caenorhabditis auriculariae TaxID=2777116 RepID=A0A8S1HYB3_9PELO|nr:unnamed protein product [Caenorhabditis auriculariae]
MVSKVTLFFIVFGTVYFLESIGGFYMTSAVVFIEKQFQIPSKLSGTMVSAGDFAYIPVVIFTSYFGGKGNRARWIGAGCILISIANFMISSSNFLFPVEKFHVNSSYIPPTLVHQINRDLIGSANDSLWLEEVHSTIDPQNRVVSNYEGDERHDLLKKYISYCHSNKGSDICQKLEYYMGQRNVVSELDVSHVRLLTSLPYAFCHSILNTIRSDHKADECKRDQSSLGPFMMIFGGLLVLGVGRTMPFSLGLPLMDDNVKRKNLPLYFSFMFFVKILGPVIGLLVGGQLNKIYYDFNPPHGLTPLDPMWIGCWWLGFLIFGALLFGPSLALYFFPSDDLDLGKEGAEEKLLDNGEVVVKRPQRLNLVDRHVRKTSDGKVHMPVGAGEKATEFFTTVSELFRNKIFIGAMLGRIVDVLAFKGYFVFLGKYLELQFGVPQFRIQRYLASTGIVGFAIGVILGSISMKKFRLEGRKAAGWVAICSLVAASLSFVNSTVGCKSVIGLMGDQAIAKNFTFDTCRDDCGCEGMPFYPVCNKAGDVFYSPCHAGCPMGWKNYSIFDNTNNPSETLIFENCECANHGIQEVSRTFCRIEECEERFNRFFMNQAMTAVFGGLSVVPGMLIVLRAVPPEHRSISLGFNGFLVSLFATLPSPILWGKIFDMSCLMWQTSCDKKGSCSIYDTDELRVRLHIIYGCLRLFSLLSDIWVFIWAKGLKLIDEDDSKKIDQKPITIEKEKEHPETEEVSAVADRVEKVAQDLDTLIDRRGS